MQWVVNLHPRRIAAERVSVNRRAPSQLLFRCDVHFVVFDRAPAAPQFLSVCRCVSVGQSRGGRPRGSCGRAKCDHVTAGPVADSKLAKMRTNTLTAAN